MLMVLHEERIPQRVAFGAGIGLLLMLLLSISCVLGVLSPHIRLQELSSAVLWL